MRLHLTNSFLAARRRRAPGLLRGLSLTALETAGRSNCSVDSRVFYDNESYPTASATPQRAQESRAADYPKSASGPHATFMSTKAQKKTGVRSVSIYSDRQTASGEI